jgi:hypothetical protein
MFNIVTYGLIGALAVSSAFGGYQLIQKTRLEKALAASQFETSFARGAEATCNARLANIQKREDRNNEVPDNLRDFPVPFNWLLPTDPGDPADSN